MLNVVSRRPLCVRLVGGCLTMLCFMVVPRAGGAGSDEGLSLAEPDSVPAIVEAFSAVWKPQQGYMRPWEDQGWKARHAALQALCRLGPQAAAELERVLQDGDAEARVLAAQAFVYLAEASTRPALERALADPEAAVRLYAVDALSMFGRLEESEPYLRLRDADPNRDVRAHVRFALARDDAPRPADIRQLLLDYKPEQAATARLGERAPDFTLQDTFGNSYQLSQYAGQSPVVLIFIYGDT
jgi:hypothetical protein